MKRFPLPPRPFHYLWPLHGTFLPFRHRWRLLYPSKLSLNFESLLNRRNLKTRSTVSNPLPSWLSLFYRNPPTTRTAETAMSRQLPQCGLIAKAFCEVPTPDAFYSWIVSPRETRRIKFPRGIFKILNSVIWNLHVFRRLCASIITVACVCVCVQKRIDRI